MTHSLKGGFGLILAAAATGCTLLLSADEQQCESAKDCSERGFDNAVCESNVCVEGSVSVDPKWACIGNVAVPEPTPGAVHTYSQQVVEIISQAPPANMQIRLCSTLDVQCATPVVDPVSFDPAGILSFQADSGFDGFLEVSSDETLPALIFLGGPLVADFEQADSVQMLSEQLFNSIATTAGFAVDPARGQLIATLVDCEGNASSGLIMTTELDPTTSPPFYLVMGSPDPAATSTDASGNAGILNAPEGFVTLTSIRAETNEFVGTTRVQIRAGSVTYVNLRPSP